MLREDLKAFIKADERLKAISEELDILSSSNVKDLDIFSRRRWMNLKKEKANLEAEIKRFKKNNGLA